MGYYSRPIPISCLPNEMLALQLTITLTITLRPAQQCTWNVTVPVCVNVRAFHHCGNVPTCHECFPLSCGFIHFGGTLAPSQQKYANRSSHQRTISKLACKHSCFLVSTAQHSICELSVLSHPPWKQALIIPYDLSLPCLGRASWNAAAAVCALRWAGRLEKTGEVWQGTV